MAVIYGSQNVDERYVPGIEPNLYTDEVLIPGVTYTDKYQIGPGGAYKVHKLDSGEEVEPGKPGRDFTDEKAEDDLITIVLNNNFQKSRKIYGVAANAVEFAIGEEYLSDSLNMTKQGRRYSALACMINEGTQYQDTQVITDDNVEDVIVGMRKQIKDNHGQANYAMVSTDVYSKMLKKLGFQEYKDPAVISGDLIKRYGLRIMECNSFDKKNAKYYDYTETLRTVDLTNVDIIVGYSEAFSLLDNMEMYRLIDSENFNGSKAQVEYNSGMRVNSPTQLVVKKKSTTTGQAANDETKIENTTPEGTQDI